MITEPNHTIGQSQLSSHYRTDRGLYSYTNEHDACGVGLVARLDNEATHDIVNMGLTVLKRLMHRGATGSDPETGDGAGILVALPDAFFRRLFPGQLPGVGKYGVAMIFGGEGHEAEMARIVREEGAEILFWRELPLGVDSIGRAAKESCPVIRQLFISGESFPDSATFERKLYVIRRLMEKAVTDLHICSCSCRSVVYKGLLLASQLELFYKDLSEADFKSPLALVHQRYSTNTFPSWELAHPFRYLAHNGEINTLKGNLNQLRSREPHLASRLLGEDMGKLLPLISPGQSDSACLDNMVELLVASGRPLTHAMLMLMPQAWGKNYHLGRDVRGFFEYNSALMEPWDGPAAVAFSDGINAGAMLDRNGLRPARYTLTQDNIFILASETGVVDIPDSNIRRKGQLRPGEMIYCDLENHRLVLDGEIKKLVARSHPYRRWVAENKISVHGLFDTINGSLPSADLREKQGRFGYSAEDLELILKPMAATGSEPIGSMGNDTPLPVLSSRPQLLFNYFKQMFAQVTNPPIDPIREELVMSLTTYIGNRANILEDSPLHARLIRMPRPILTDDEISRLRKVAGSSFSSTTLPMEFPAEGDGAALQAALDRLAQDAVNAVREGFRIIILSDKTPRSGTIPIPSLLAVSCVNQALVASGLRPETGIIVESGEVRETMHFALLFGYGATAVNPYLALESVSALSQSGETGNNIYTAAGNYIRAIDKGLLKIMSKMGISTLRSYRSAQLFEAVGLGDSLIQQYFPGTSSRIGGISLEEIAQEVKTRCGTADESTDKPLPVGGLYKYRKNGENHLWTPSSVTAFHQAVRNNDPAKYREFAESVNQQSERLCTLRGLFGFTPTTAIPLDQVESVESLVRRFVSGAMSLGSLSPEAHETIAIAMNRLGAMSNCGEGGEDAARYTPLANGANRMSAIKQIASGRFGVTIDYLRHARELQIKMAQGAKPGEGGQLPGHKVDSYIAGLRHSVPHVSLISPPPHHDIYSIEDLAQLIYDLRCANPAARISVKLVSETGVGTIAAGVVKAHADMVLVSGHDGGTGASPLSSIKYAGLPWELGLAETQQTLVLNGLRSRVRLQVDGQIKTGRDVIIGALLGAEEFGFGTTILVAMGCAMLRKCHENTCPVGIATQDAELRKKFTGKPEYIENYLRFVAGEVREYLAALGLRSLDDAVGRSDLLEMKRGLEFFKAQHLDFSRIFLPATEGATRFDPSADNEVLQNYDRTNLLGSLAHALETGTPSELRLSIKNVDRTVGTELSGEIVARHGEGGLPEDTFRLHFTGCAGQSFGAFLAPGVTLDLTGEANDFVGKGLSGGKIIIRKPFGLNAPAESNSIAGNVIGYGGTSGQIFINGRAGERFAVRNSGITAVVEGIGDHGCEYMTGGRVLILGEVGVNFAAGMTGGIAYVYAPGDDFDLRCNLDTVDLESIAPGSPEQAEIMDLLRRHWEATGSQLAHDILANWHNERPRFVQVLPVEYRQALGRMEKEDAEAVNRLSEQN